MRIISVLDHILVLFLIAIGTCRGNLPSKIRIAALLDEQGDEKHRLAFEYAVNRINQQPQLLNNRMLEAEVVRIAEYDSFTAQRVTCSLLEKGVIAIFGPQNSANADHIKSITDTLEIPFMDTRWNLDNIVPFGGDPDYTVNLHPDVKTLGRALIDIINAYGWDYVTILYEDNDSIIRIKELLDFTSEIASPDIFQFVMKQLVSTPEDGYREVLREIFKMKAKYIIVDCSRNVLADVLKQAQQIGMMSDDYFYVLTNLDAHTIDFEDFKHGGTNFTTIRLIDTSKPEVQSVIRSIVSAEFTKGRSFGVVEGYLDTNTALIYDAVHLFAFALSELMRAQDIIVTQTSCERNEPWKHGNSFANFMKIIKFNGLSGLTKFNPQGQRTHLELDILELQKNGMSLIGSWTTIDGLNISRVEEKVQVINPTNIMANRTFVVTLIENAPYTMLKLETKRLKGNDRFEGFAIDLMKDISEILDFNITFKLVDDGKYGNQDEHGNWNGLIKEVLLGADDGGADFAVADLSITTARSTAVVFSMPWMTLGISIVYIKARPAPPDLLSFLSPFTLEVWIYTGFAFVFVSVVLYVLARFSPYEWNNPYPCIEEPEELENQFNIVNSFWFTIGSLMQQGSDVAPTATSTRLVAGMWYFFALIMISSYTANLAAFLTVETLEKPFESAEDLAKQTDIKYGVVEGGSTENFFKTSTFETYQKMWEFMSGVHRQESMMPGNSDGIEAVINRDGKYAFMMESSSIEYIIERECSLSQVGGLLDNKGYGIATAPGTPYKNLLDSAILRLQEDGVLFKRKTKWWKRKRGGGACANAGGGGAVSELGLPNVAGVFLVTLLGCIVAIFSALLELLYGAKLQADDLGTTWLNEIKEEIRFAFKCHGTSKTVRKPMSDVNSVGESDSHDLSINRGGRALLRKHSSIKNNKVVNDYAKSENSSSIYGLTKFVENKEKNISENQNDDGNSSNSTGASKNPFE
ncbi:glutamate receptor ionotropic, kainate 2 [Lepeophtheirus salmonis]|uniref:glutamate receptor ionotropic, kainate 2 n=1 Tax=Lepeophtheirus salmonis TaxID=72036 RepID=UPI001AE752AB|nr:glutamate receptor ionotropic, kainate 2-like [Lepeophtheirus salmonis]